MPATDQRLPVVFVPHGGGPWPFVKVGIGSEAEQTALATFLSSLRDLPPTPPRALLVISAHWEEGLPTVMSHEKPPLLYDYSGFPAESYRLTWPAPGDPVLAERVRELLGEAGIPCASNRERGFDHGAFVPLKVAYPDAELPTLQLSLKAGLDPREHLAIGRALAPLRDEGVFIVGSGMTYHNMRGFGPAFRPAASAFDAWLRDSLTASPRERDRLLSEWQNAPSARQAHPREEHLLPLMVAAGAAGSDRGRVSFRGTFFGLDISAYAFG